MKADTRTELHPDQAAILADGEEALGRIDRHETFHDWLKVGKSIVMWREVAMSIAETNDMDSYAYRQAFKSIKPDYPNLAKLNKTERSHAAWLWEHHDGLEAWHGSLTPNQARQFNHPSTIWRKNPLGEYREKKTRSTQKQKDDLVARLEEVAERVEVATAVNPGLDLSDPEMIEASAQTLVDYYGAKPTAELIVRAAPLVGRKVIAEDEPEKLLDLRPRRIGATARKLVDIHGVDEAAALVAALVQALPIDIIAPLLKRVSDGLTGHPPMEPAPAPLHREPRLQRPT